MRIISGQPLALTLLVPQSAWATSAPVFERDIQIKINFKVRILLLQNKLRGGFFAYPPTLLIVFLTPNMSLNNNGSMNVIFYIGFVEVSKFFTLLHQ